MASRELPEHIIAELAKAEALRNESRRLSNEAYCLENTAKNNLCIDLKAQGWCEISCPGESDYGDYYHGCWMLLPPGSLPQSYILEERDGGWASFDPEEDTELPDGTPFTPLEPGTWYNLYE